MEQKNKSQKVAQGKVLLVGGTGFLGRTFGMRLTEDGYSVHCVDIEPASSKAYLNYPCAYFEWDGKSMLTDEALAGVNIVINVAGEPISDGRWVDTKRKTILDSRLRATKAAVDAANRSRAATMIQASSIDIYGDSRGEIVTESSSVGKGFWPEAIAQWEKACAPLNPSIRLVTLRMGEVLCLWGGPFRDRLATYSQRIGSPQIGSDQYHPWISSFDLYRMVKGIIEDPRWEGPINASAPTPSSFLDLHKQFTKYYENCLRLPYPRWLRKLVRGDEVERFCYNRKAIPQKAQELGFRFSYPDIASAMARLLDRDTPQCTYQTLSQWVPAPPEQVWQFLRDGNNWAKLNPQSIRLKLKPDSPHIAEEGAEFAFNIYYFGFVRAPWRVRHTTVIPNKMAKSLVQEGLMSMLEMSQELTPVAGGTRLDELMRFQYPINNVFAPVLEAITLKINLHINRHRQMSIAKTFSQSTEVQQDPLKKAS